MSATFAPIYVALTVMLAVALVRHASKRDRLPLLVAALAVLSSGAVTAWLTHAFEVPTAWVTVLQEGTGETNVRHLYGRGMHAGPNAEWLVSLLGPGVILRSIVRANLVLATANVALFAAIAWFVHRRAILALVFALAFAFDLAFVHGAVSELPSQLLVSFFLLGVVAAHVWTTAEDTGTKDAALGALIALAVLAALTRIETAVVSAPAAALAVTQRVVGSARVDGWARATHARIAAAAEWSKARWLGLAAAGLALWVAGHATVGAFGLSKHAEAAVDGLSPVNVRFLSLPLALTHVLPAGVVLLAAFGVVHGFRNLRRFFFLPISLLVLYRTYVSSSHGVFYELFRYLTMLSPLAVFFALFGWREIAHLAKRVGWVRWRGAALALVIALAAMGPAPGSRDSFRVGDYLRDADARQILLTRDLQIEARWMLDLVDRYPECAFVTRTSNPPHERHDRRHHYLLFGRPLDGEVALSRFPTDAAEVTARYTDLHRPIRCIRIYRGLDCDHESTAGCEAEIGSRAPLEEAETAALPYRDIPEYGTYAPRVRFAVYPLD